MSHSLADYAHPGTRGGNSLGLVTCAKTEFLSKQAARHPFPTVEELQAGAAAVGAFEWDGHEGAVPMLEVSAGLVRLTAPDLNRRERRLNRAADAPLAVSTEEEAERAWANSPVHEFPELAGEVGERIITGWSRRSRARMVATMAELDLAPLLMQDNAPAMVTLTYPSDWETVAPDGETVKKHLKELRARFRRAWDADLMAVWKLEFQRRGAPHFHLLMVPPKGRASAGRRAEYELRVAMWEAGVIARKPRWKSMAGDGETFARWLSLAWADIVAHPDPVERMKHECAGTAVDYAEGSRARDPKRAAVYFGKHGSFASKDYQHEVPELWRASGKSVGRFWGYWGLSKVKAAATLSFDAMLLLGRVLRKYGTRTKVWDDATNTHIVRPVMRTVYKQRKAGEWVSPAGVRILKFKARKQSVRAKRMTGKWGAGFLLVNDGAAMARDLGRVLRACGEARPERVPVGMRGSVQDRRGGRGY